MIAQLGYGLPLFSRDILNRIGCFAAPCGKMAPSTEFLCQQVESSVSRVRVKKRFVAGAKCPKCHAQDSIVLFKEQGVETVECVECDYREQQAEAEVAKQATGAVIGVFKP